MLLPFLRSPYAGSGHSVVQQVLGGLTARTLSLAFGPWNVAFGLDSLTTRRRRIVRLRSFLAPRTMVHLVHDGQCRPHLPLAGLAIHELLLRRRAGGGGTTNHIPLLDHGPEIGCHPLGQQRDRELHANADEDERESIPHALLLARHRVVLRRRRHVL